MDFKLSCVILALPLLATMASLAAAQSCVDKDVCMGEMSYCKCQTGNDTMVDLSQVQKVEVYNHHAGLNHPNERIIFNPCHPFNEGNCKDSVVCMVKTTMLVIPAGQYNLASLNEAKFSKCGENLVLKYEHLVRSKKMTTEVTLICDETAAVDSLKLTSESEGKAWPQLPGDVKLELRSKSVCPKAFTPTTPTPSITPTTLPHNITTATVPHSNTTVTVPHSNTTVTVPHSNTTVTVPHSNTTVTTPHINTTVTVPPSDTTTPENSAVSMSSTSAAVFIGITAIAKYIL